MKRFIKTIAAAATVLIACRGAAMTAMAATEGDVIAAARAIGMPESEISAYVAQYGGRQYTSEQYDRAVAAVYAQRDKYANKNNSVDANSGNEAETEAETEAATSPNAEFFEKDSKDRIKTITDMSEAEAEEFYNSLTEDEKEELKKTLGTEDISDLSKAANKAAEELGLVETTVETETESEAETTVLETEAVTTAAVTTTAPVIEDTKKSKSYAVPLAVGAAVVIVLVIASFAALGRKKNGGDK